MHAVVEVLSQYTAQASEVWFVYDMATSVLMWAIRRVMQEVHLFLFKLNSYIFWSAVLFIWYNKEKQWVLSGEKNL